MSASSPARLADRRNALPDVQATAPEHAIALSRVGVTSLRMPIELAGGKTIARLQMSVDLPARQRGAHMSRFRRAVDGVPTTLDAYGFAKALAAGLLRAHPYAASTDVRLEIDDCIDDLVLPVVASHREGPRRLNETPDGSSIELRLLGSTVCPCSYAMSGERHAHVQRAELVLQVFDPRLTVAALHALGQHAFSAPVSMLLDRPAEKALVDRMFAQPRFIEDVTREAIHRLRTAKAGSAARVTATAFESIHPYDCFAGWEGAL